MVFFEEESIFGKPVRENINGTKTIKLNVKEASQVVIPINEDTPTVIDSEVNLTRKYSAVYPDTVVSGKFSV